MPRITLMHNPKAGHGSPGPEELVSYLRDAGFKPRYQSTCDKDYVGALKKPADFVVVAGGDGTVRKIAKRLVGGDLPMAILPLGTANNIAKSLGIDLVTRRSIAALSCARVDNFDVGVARGPWGKKVFFEGFGIGLLVEVMNRLQVMHRRGRGVIEAADAIGAGLRALRETLPHFEAADMEATLDGEDVGGRFLLLEFLNVRMTGPNLDLAPMADSSDRLLDLVCVAEREREAFDAYLAKRLEGCRDVLGLTVRRGCDLRIAWHGARVRFDDKVWPKGRVKIDERIKEVIRVAVKKQTLRMLTSEALG